MNTVYSVMIGFLLVSIVSPERILAADMPQEDKPESPSIHHATQALIESVHAGNVLRVEELLRISGIDPNGRDKQGNTALMYACRKGCVPLIERLLAAGADLEIQNPRASCYHYQFIYCAGPLLEALYHGRQEAVIALLDAGANINHPNVHGDTPLMVAARAKESALAQMLIDKGALIHLLNNSGESALRIAVEYGQDTIVKALLAVGAAVKETRQASTLLHVAAYHGRVSLIPVLIAAGLVVDGKGKKSHTPLMVASSEGHLTTVQALMAAGADIELKNYSGESALMLAVFHNHADIVKSLIAARAQLNVCGMYNNTALMYAAYRGNLEITNALLVAGADSTIQNSDTDSALSTALKHAHSGIVRLLLNASRKLAHERYRHNDTPLMKAVRTDHAEIIAALLEAGADINGINDNGETALMKACQEHKAVAFAELLSSPFIDLMMCTNNGKTIYDLLEEFPDAAIKQVFDRYEEEHQVMIKPAAKRARIEESDDE